MHGVPSRFIGKCERCGRELDVREDGVHQFTSGWVMVRSQGGGHAIAIAKRENRWMHSWCIDLEKREMQHQGQGALF